jgi:hypothetical protein
MNKLTAAALLSAAFATPSLAEDGLYYGLGLGSSSMTSEFSGLFGAKSSLDSVVLGVTFGYRRDAGSMFFAAEMDGDLSLGQEFIGGTFNLPCAPANAQGPYHCTHDMTVRLRGVVGTQIGAYEVFGSLGAVQVRGTSAVNVAQTDDVINTGHTFGLGIQRPLGTGTGRLELIYDRASNDNGPNDGLGNVYSPDYEAVTLKATFLF